MLLPWTLISAAVATAAYRRGVAKGGSSTATTPVDYSSSSVGYEGEGKDEDVASDSEAVESVLAFWFDGSTADNHRTKWFAQVNLCWQGDSYY